LVAAHIPFQLLPESIKSSSCPIIYVCRDPKDVFVSLWHFANKLRPKELPPLSIEEAFDLFCQGVSPFGSYWDHVLGYWKASKEMPNKVLFVRYEDMKSQPVPLMKKLAEFIGCPFSYEEENNGVIEKIIDFCSFENLTSFEVNRIQKERKTLPGTNIANNVFFRKGNVGDYKNYMTVEMIKRLKEITEERFKDSRLQLYTDA
ncbi:Cytosolic sulfotransferase 17, partial [Bienertia sinuspersici]